MKRKLLVTILSLTVGLSIAACGKQETTTATESIPATVESTQTEASVTEESTEEIKETEIIEVNANETETIEEPTETEESEEETAGIKNGEPLSEKDLAFSFFGYDTYNEYVEAGNNYAAYILADNANMIVTGEFVDEGDVIESTVRGIKLGDSIDKVIERYGQADKYDTFNKNDFSHDGLKDTDQYIYFLKIDSTKDYFYAFTFIADQYKDVIGVLIEPIPMRYWSSN